MSGVGGRERVSEWGRGRERVSEWGRGEREREWGRFVCLLVA